MRLIYAAGSEDDAMTDVEAIFMLSPSRERVAKQVHSKQLLKSPKTRAEEAVYKLRDTSSGILADGPLVSSRAQRKQSQDFQDWIQ
jgi:hypothetical protein